MDTLDFQGLINDKTNNSINLKELSLSAKHRTGRAMHAARQRVPILFAPQVAFR